MSTPRKTFSTYQEAGAACDKLVGWDCPAPKNGWTWRARSAGSSPPLTPRLTGLLPCAKMASLKITNRPRSRPGSARPRVLASSFAKKNRRKG